MFIEATLVKEADQQKVIERASIKETQIQECFDILGLQGPQITCKQIKIAYFNLSSIYHPDKDVHNREKYFQILSAYQTLDKYLSQNPFYKAKPIQDQDNLYSSKEFNRDSKEIEPSRGFVQIETMKLDSYIKDISNSKDVLDNSLEYTNRGSPLSTENTLNKSFLEPDEELKQKEEISSLLKSYKKPSFQDRSIASDKTKQELAVIQEPLFLQYTVHIDWLAVLEKWVQGLDFIRTFKYSYISKCLCEQICLFCKGTGYTAQKMYCSTCNGRGSCNYCDKCAKTGTYTAKDHVELVLYNGKKVPKRIVYPNKGDDSGSIRKDLVLKIKSIGAVSKIKDNLYVYRKYLQKKDLVSPTYTCEFLSYKIEIDLTKVDRIPHYHKIEGRPVYIGSKRIQFYLMIGLDP